MVKQIEVVGMLDYNMDYYSGFGLWDLVLLLHKMVVLDVVVIDGLYFVVLLYGGDFG